jgi:hypothetical protein
MSFVTTPPEMLASVPSRVNAWLLAGGSHDCPRDGAGMGGNRMERRRSTVSKWILDRFAGTARPSNCVVRR